MLGILRWIGGKLFGHWDFVAWIAGSAWMLIGAAVTGWATWAAGIFAQYAPFSWVMAGLVGAVLNAFIFWIVARGYFWYAQARWTKMMASPGEGVNPLDENFVRRRIKIGDLVSRVNPVIENKTFDRCELVGPALVILEGVNLMRSSFMGCNLMCCKDNFPVFAAVVLRNTSIINSKIFEITFIVPESRVDDMKGLPNGFWLSRIPDEFGLPASSLKPPPELMAPPVNPIAS